VELDRLILYRNYLERHLKSLRSSGKKIKEAIISIPDLVDDMDIKRSEFNNDIKELKLESNSLVL
jgi:hypothetical protein